MKWDKNKKRYVQVNVGSDGKISKTKNESGKFVNYKKDKDPELYRRWMRRTHLKIQDTGEQEDRRTVQNAQSYHKDRRELKRMGKKASNIKGRPGQQVRGMDQVEKAKNDKRKDKEKTLRGKRRDPKSQSSVQFRKKIQEKVEARSRPTKSKIIMKARKNKGKGRKR